MSNVTSRLHMAAIQCCFYIKDKNKGTLSILRSSLILDPPELTASVDVGPTDTGLTSLRSLRQVTTYWISSKAIYKQFLF